MNRNTDNPDPAPSAPQAAAERVCAVIVSYHTGESIYRCVESVSGQVGQVIVIDYGSDPETVKALQKLEMEPKASVIYNSENRGIAAALNQGVRFANAADFQWILLLDDDSLVTSGMVEKLLGIYERLGDAVGIAAPTLFDRNTGTVTRWRGGCAATQ